MFLSDFLGPLDALEAALATAADRGVTGALVQVLDPAEEAFPFDGRTVFHSVGGGVEHETREAGGLRDALPATAGRAQGAARRARPARPAGNTTSTTPTTAPAAALLWLYRALEGRI